MRNEKLLRTTPDVEDREEYDPSPFICLNQDEKDALLGVYLRNDPTGSALLKSARQLAEEHGVSDFMPQLLERALPPQVLQLASEYRADLSFSASSLENQVSLDQFERLRRLNEQYVKSCVWVEPPYDKQERISPGQAPFAAPTVEELHKLVGTIEITVPGTAPAPAISQNSLVDSRRLGRNETALNESYGVAWTTKKIVRDIFQNFYDGQGGSLDGVRITIERTQAGMPFIVTIHGAGEFPHDLLVNIGATTKASDSKSAGHFGEGGKLIPLQLLRGGSAHRCSYTSRNWQLDFEIAANEGGRSKLFYTLSETADTSGNSLRIESSDPAFIAELCGGMDLFYYSQHPDFANVHLENKRGGISLLPPGKKGNLYICGQRFEVDSDEGSTPSTAWESSLAECTIWSHRKLSSTGRDRIAFPIERVTTEIVKPILRESSSRDLVKMLFDLRDYWKVTTTDDDAGPLLLSALIEEIRQRNVLTSFPPEYQAVPPSAEPSVLRQAAKEGKVPCRAIFGELGMNRRHYAELLEHIDLVRITREEGLRLALLQEGCSVLLDSIIHKDVLYTAHPALTRIDPYLPVCVFETRTASLKNIGFAIPKAFHFGDLISWNRSRLNDDTFYNALTTHLHELTHVYGGDKTRVFTIKMSRWIQVALQTMSSPEVAEKLCALEFVWNTIDQNKSMPK
jgi:hypothetical protein